MQFKVVEDIRVPKDDQWRSRGFGKRYYRSELSLKPNQTTKISQHQTLVRVSNIQNASVSYACPMLFNVEDIFKEPKIEDLRCVNIKTAPKPSEEWFTQKRHFIAFRDKYDPKPDWCSEPHVGEAQSFSDWARKSLKELSGEELRVLLFDTIHAVESLEK